MKDKDDENEDERKMNFHLASPMRMNRNIGRLDENREKQKREQNCGTESWGLEKLRTRNVEV